MHIARLSTGAATAVAAAVQLLAYSAGHAGAFQVVGNAAAPAASAVSVASGGARFAAPHVVKTHHRHHHHHNVNSNSNANAITPSYSMAARPTALHFSSNNYNPSYRGNSSCSNDNNSRRSGEISRSAFCSRAPTPPPRPTTQTTAAAAQSPAAYRALSSSSFSSPPRRPSGGERRGRATGRLSMMASGGGGAGGKGDGGGDKGGKGQGGRGKKGESVQNRALATVVYLLPMLDGIECGENVFRVVPQLGGVVHTVLAPALAVWDNVPFLPIVMFIILQVSVRRQNTSRFIRFNIQQAILVDILTVVLGLLGTAVGTLVPEGEQFLTNFSFYCLAAAVAYAVGETARGRVANQIPLISAAAEIQLGPS